jgi:hypothetical protein
VSKNIRFSLNNRSDRVLSLGVLPLGSTGSTRKHHVLLGSPENAIKRNAAPGNALEYNEWVQDSVPVPRSSRFIPTRSFIAKYCQRHSHSMNILFSNRDVIDFKLAHRNTADHCCLRAPEDPAAVIERISLPLYMAMTDHLKSLKPLDRLNSSSVSHDCPVYRFFYKDIPLERVLMDRALIGAEETIPIGYADASLQNGTVLDEIVKWRNEIEATKNTTGALTHVPSFSNPMRLLRQIFYSARFINNLMKNSTTLKEELTAVLPSHDYYIHCVDILLSSFERTTTLLHNHLVRIAYGNNGEHQLPYPMSLLICPTATAKKLGDDFHIPQRFFFRQICNIDKATGKCTASHAEHAQNILKRSLNFAYSIFWNVALCELLYSHLQEYEDQIAFNHPNEFNVSLPSKLSDEEVSRLEYDFVIASDLAAIRQAKYLVFSKKTSFIPLLSQMVLFQKWEDTCLASTPHRSLLNEYYPSCESFINAGVLPSTSNTYFMAISGLCSSMKHLNSVWSAMVHLLGKMQIVGKCTSRAIYTAVSKRSHDVPIIHIWTMWLIFMCLMGGYDTSKFRQKMGMCMSLYTNFILFMPSISGAAIFEKCQYLLQHAIRYFMFHCIMKEGTVWDVLKRTQKRYHELSNLLDCEDEYIRRSIAEIGLVTTEEQARAGASELIYRVEKTLKDGFNKEVREHYEGSRRSLTFASAMCSKLNQIIIKLSEDAIEDAEDDTKSFQRYGIKGKIETQSITGKNEVNFQTKDGRDLFFSPMLPTNFDESFLDKLALASAQRTDSLIYFSQLEEVGMTPEGVKKFGSMMMRWVSLGMFENALIAKCRNMLERNPADFFIAFIYLRKILKCMTCYTILLSHDIAMKQIRALRSKIGLEPWTPTPEFPGHAIICDKHGHLNPVIDGHDKDNAVNTHHVYLNKYYYNEEGRICCSGEDMTMTNNVIPNTVLDRIPGSDLIMGDIQEDMAETYSQKKVCNFQLRVIDMIGKVLCNDGVMTALCSKCGCICRVHNENFYTDEVTCLNHGEIESAPGFNYSDIATSAVLGNAHLTPVTGRNECRICGKSFDRLTAKKSATPPTTIPPQHSIPVIGFSGNIEWISVCLEHYKYLVNFNNKKTHTLRNLEKILPEIIETTKIPQLTQLLAKG